MPHPVAVANNPLPQFRRLPNGDVEVLFGEFQDRLVLPSDFWVEAVHKVSKSPTEVTFVNLSLLHGTL